MISFLRNFNFLKEKQVRRGSKKMTGTRGKNRTLTAIVHRRGKSFLLALVLLRLSSFSSELALSVGLNRQLLLDEVSKPKF